MDLMVLHIARQRWGRVLKQICDAFMGAGELLLRRRKTLVEKGEQYIVFASSNYIDGYFRATRRLQDANGNRRQGRH